jgi:non-ribosomal peptide synthetase component E (peptide arylation enzyme)
LPRDVGAVLDSALTRDPDHEAVVGSDGRLSYGDLDRAADRAAAALVELGVGRRDVVAVSLPNTTEIVVLFHAVMRRGGRGRADDARF